MQHEEVLGVNPLNRVELTTTQAVRKIQRGTDIDPQALTREHVPPHLFLPFDLDDSASDDLHVLSDRLPFIIDPVELPFHILKKIALRTLWLANELAPTHTLADAKPQNFQPYKGNYVLIDHGSVVKRKPETPFYPAGEIVLNFALPLALESYTGIPFRKVDIQHVGLLPAVSFAKIFQLLYFHMARMFQHKKAKPDLKVSDEKYRRGLDLIKRLIQSIKLKEFKPDYETDALKKEQVKHKIEEFRPKRVIDVGAYAGDYSHLAALSGAELVIAIENDAAAVNHIALTAMPQVIPIMANWADPTPATGIINQERRALMARFWDFDADLLLFLGVIHHIRIRDGIPVAKIIQSIAFTEAKRVIIELVTIDDDRARELAPMRPDLFSDLREEPFRRELERCFSIEQTHHLSNTRILYVASRRS